MVDFSSRSTSEIRAERGPAFDNNPILCTAFHKDIASAVHHRLPFDGRMHEFREAFLFASQCSRCMRDFLAGTWMQRAALKCEANTKGVSYERSQIFRSRSAAR